MNQNVATPKTGQVSQGQIKPAPKIQAARHAGYKKSSKPSGLKSPLPRHVRHLKTSCSLYRPTGLIPFRHSLCHGGTRIL